MSSAAFAVEHVWHPAVYPELGAECWCRVLSPEVVAACAGCGFAIQEGVHASDVVFGFYCADCCPACRTVPTEADREVMARNVEAKIEGVRRGRGKGMRYSAVKSLTLVAGRDTRTVAKTPAEGNEMPVRKTKHLQWGQPFTVPALPDSLRRVKAKSRLARGIDLLAREQGATLDELREHLKVKTEIKGWLAYDLRRGAGYGYRSEDGVRVKLVLAEGMSGPLAHRQSVGRLRRFPSVVKDSFNG